MKNEKGYTLVELLTILSILGILVTLVMISANKIIAKGNKTYFHTQENMILLSAKEYMSDHRSLLPKKMEEAKKITLRSLIEENYIEEVRDVNDKICDFDASFITVTKQDSNEYQYKVFLVCPSSHYSTK